MSLSKPMADVKSLRYVLACLDERQQMYVDARTRGSVPVVAARMAGYPDADESAEKLEKDLTVRTAIEQSIRVKAHEVQHTRERVLDMLQYAYDMAASSGEMTAAAREIGRIIGAYAPVQIETKTLHMTQEQIKAKSDDELLKILEGEAVRVQEETDGEVLP